MYDNPKHIKKHPVKSRYDDFEREHLARAAEKAGEQTQHFSVTPPCSNRVARKTIKRPCVIKHKNWVYRQRRFNTWSR